VVEDGRLLPPPIFSKPLTLEPLVSEERATNVEHLSRLHPKVLSRRRLHWSDMDLNSVKFLTLCNPVCNKHQPCLMLHLTANDQGERVLQTAQLLRLTYLHRRVELVPSLGLALIPMPVLVMITWIMEAVCPARKLPELLPVVKWQETVE